MSYIRVIRHIETILNQCGDSIVFIPTGSQTIGSGNRMSIEIEDILIKRQNRCGIVSQPSPLSNNNPPDKYLINRIRITPSLADDYSKGFPFTDDEVRKLISDNDFLFGYY